MPEMEQMDGGNEGRAETQGIMIRHTSGLVVRHVEEFELGFDVWVFPVM
jgi:hypothetical protein